MTVNDLKRESVDHAGDHHQIGAREVAGHDGRPRHRHGLDFAGEHRSGCGRSAGNEDQVDVEPVFLEQPGLFGNPDRRKRAGLGAVADIHSLEFFLRPGRRDLRE